jgi:hypothetical protein
MDDPITLLKVNVVGAAGVPGVGVNVNTRLLPCVAEYKPVMLPVENELETRVAETAEDGGTPTVTV